MFVELDGYIDYDSFGRQKMEKDGVRETAHGYVKRLSEPFPDLGFEQAM